MDFKEDQESLRLLLSRCLRETLCERLLSIGILDHIGTDTELVERILWEIWDRQALDTMTTDATTGRTNVGESVVDFQRCLRLAEPTVEQIRAAGFLDAVDMENQLVTFKDLQDVVSLKRNQMAIRNPFAYPKVTAVTTEDVCPAENFRPVQQRLGTLLDPHQNSAGESDDESPEHLSLTNFPKVARELLPPHSFVYARAFLAEGGRGKVQPFHLTLN